MPTKKRQPSAEHKAAMAEGRKQGRVVRAYLDAVEAHKPKRGRKRTAESINSRLEQLDSTIKTEANSARRVELVQERLDLQDQLAALESKDDLAELEKEFISIAADYSDRKGISYSAWREVGVPAAVLREAGITRTRTATTN